MQVPYKNRHVDAHVHLGMSFITYFCNLTILGGRSKM